MTPLIKARSNALERMDVETLSPQDIHDILRALEKVNRWLGGVRATLSRLERFSIRWTPGERLRFVDWGTGGADIPRAVAEWCRARGYRAEIVGVDSHPAIAAYARDACRAYPEISILEADAVTFPDPAEPFDYALSSLTLHHLSNEQIVSLLRRSDRLIRRGLVMNDLIRSARAWAWIWGLTRLLGAHPVVQHDAPLSVKRAFRRKDLRALAAQAGLPYLSVETHFGYRMTLAGEKV